MENLHEELLVCHLVVAENGLELLDDQGTVLLLPRVFLLLRPQLASPLCSGGGGGGGT